MKRALLVGAAGLALMLAGCADRQVEAYGPPVYGQAPGYSEARQQGFHDGVIAARHDLHERRRPDFDDHDRFRHPPVRGEFRDEYRHGFREGYRREMERAR